MHQDVPQEYNCSQCEHTSKFKGNLDKHIRTKHKLEKYPCSSCPYKATMRSLLCDHEMAIHKGILHECNECRQQFTFKVALRKHIKLKHSEESLGVDCETCFLRLSCKAALKVHMRKHTGERPYKCEKCEESFRQPVHLKNHLHNVHI